MACGVEYLPSGLQCQPRVLRPGEARHVEADHLVAHELVDQCVGANKYVSTGLEESIHATGELGGLKVLSQRGRATHVGKQQRNLDLGAAHRHLRETVAAKMRVFR